MFEIIWMKIYLFGPFYVIQVACLIRGIKKQDTASAMPLKYKKKEKNSKKKFNCLLIFVEI